MADIKFPRVMVSHTRHKKLSAEARKRKTTIQEVSEEKFKQAESKK